MKPPGAWLICYDIADPRRLARVHRAACRFAVPVQYSVFWARLDRAALDHALRVIAMLIDPHADDVRFYPLPEHVRVHVVGRAVLPDGVRLRDPGMDRFLMDEARAAV